MLPCEFEAAVGGCGALSFVVTESLDTSPQLVGVGGGEEALYPPPAGLLGPFNAIPQVGAGSAEQGNVPQPEG